MQTYGSVNRAVKIDDSATDFHTNLIVEYNHGTAMQALEPLLPCTHPSSVGPEVTFLVRALASIYTQKVSSDVTQTYLDKLKGIAKLSGKDFEEVLKEVMSQIEESIEVLNSVSKLLPPNTHWKLRRLQNPASMTLHHSCWLMLPLPLDLTSLMSIREQLLPP